MVAGETAMTVALADSLFLSISPDAARTKVMLFLAVSMAPFAIVAPFVGPLVDRMRGGQRMVVLMVAILRALVLIGMMQSLDSLALFPLAFASLVLAKTYSIKSFLSKLFHPAFAAWLISIKYPHCLGSSPRKA